MDKKEVLRHHAIALTAALFDLIINNQSLNGGVHPRHGHDRDQAPL